MNVYIVGKLESELAVCVAYVCICVGAWTKQFINLGAKEVMGLKIFDWDLISPILIDIQSCVSNEQALEIHSLSLYQSVLVFED